MYKMEQLTTYDDNLDEIQCGHLTCDEISTLRLNDVLKESGKYIFQTKMKSKSSSAVVLSITNQECTFNTTPTWQRFVNKFDGIDTTTRKYIELTFPPGEYWFYHTKLETGSLPTAWSEATEDINYKLTTIYSQFTQRADGIEAAVGQKQDANITSIRYIRDWLDGSNVDNKNYWGEINVITHDGENLLDSSLVRLQAKNEALSTVTVNNIERIKDGTLSSHTIDTNGNTVYHYSEDDYVINTGKTCIEIDLGQIYNDIDYIRIWHRFADGKFVFNHKLQTSVDGVTWVTLYDSSVTGGYEESVDGKLYYLNESNIISSMNKLSMTLNETRSQLSDTSGNLSTLTQTVKGINETVSKNYEDANSALVKLREDLNAKISETEKALANFRIEAGNIYATAESVDKNNNKLASLIQQSSNGWEALFAELNMGENKGKYNIQTNMTLNKNGITVTNPSTGQTTQMTIDQFCGLYHGEKVFWIDKDTTKTRRLLCEKGWDTDYIKMTTNAYKYANGTVVKGVAFVKSGGTS